MQINAELLFARLAAVAASVKNASNKNTGALYFTSMYCNSRGLSRDGADFLAKSGVCLGAKTFSCISQVQVNLYRSALLTMLLAHLHTIWIDNYNKGYQRLMLNLEVGSFHHIDGTALVLVLLNNAEAFCSPEAPGAAQIIPRVLSCKHLEAFLLNFENYQNSNLLLCSLTHALKLYNNPLKPAGAKDNAAFAACCLGSPSDLQLSCSVIVAANFHFSWQRGSHLLTWRSAPFQVLSPTTYLWTCGTATLGPMKASTVLWSSLMNSSLHTLTPTLSVADVNIYWQESLPLAAVPLQLYKCWTSLSSFFLWYKSSAAAKNLADNSPGV